MIKNIFKTKLSFLFMGTLVIMLFSFVGCDQQSKGFALPEGDAAQGELLFSMLKCNECHSVGDIKWIGNEYDPNVPLGGDVSSLKSYGELVTSVINPSHKIAKAYKKTGATSEGVSKMMVYNEIITVQELVDIVTFLQTEYNIVPPPTDYYPY